jgi:hypothetical protein
VVFLAPTRNAACAHLGYQVGQTIPSSGCPNDLSMCEWRSRIKLACKIGGDTDAALAYGSHGKAYSRVAVARVGAGQALPAHIRNATRSVLFIVTLSISPCAHQLL